MEQQGRILTKNWDLYDTQNVVYKTKNISTEALKNGYDWVYRFFYSWENITKSGFNHDTFLHSMKHLLYTIGWKKFDFFLEFYHQDQKLKKYIASSSIHFE